MKDLRLTLGLGFTLLPLEDMSYAALTNETDEYCAATSNYHFYNQAPSISDVSVFVKSVLEQIKEKNGDSSFLRLCDENGLALAPIHRHQELKKGEVILERRVMLDGEKIFIAEPVSVKEIRGKKVAPSFWTYAYDETGKVKKAAPFEYSDDPAVFAATKNKQLVNLRNRLLKEIHAAGLSHILGVVYTRRAHVDNTKQGHFVEVTLERHDGRVFNMTSYVTDRESSYNDHDSYISSFTLDVISASTACLFLGTSSHKKVCIDHGNGKNCAHKKKSYYFTPSSTPDNPQSSVTTLSAE
ncbi:hypothetical protein ACH42_10045 [Endozoicomonas sp. (ex Bugula neritina AB1)]|nr:hypothetical protein ACH42_10045 [Endozoicomonas sp. (ex Bugula neritina AB1)]